MLNIGGELAFILQDIEFNSKTELLEKLRKLRDNLVHYSKEERKMIKPNIVIAIQQAYYISEWELLNYKKFCDMRRNNDNNSNS